MENSCLFIILGASGDLTKKKLIPAIYNLVLNKKIKNYAVIGVSRKTKVKDLIENFKPYINNINGGLWKELEKRIYHFNVDFYDEKCFNGLSDLIKKVEKKHNLSGNRLFYLATLPEHFETIVKNINRCHLSHQNETWSRIVFEKPFGRDLNSAKKLNKVINKVFKENQVYRMDHYLGKELVQNLSIIRFTNTIFEPLWNKNYIDHVQIVLSENIGIEQRGNFYDKYGALKDVMQNHMLQLLALTSMESPKKLTEKYIRDEKVKILKSVKIKDVVLGQYEGYKKENGVKNNSNTETFAATKLYINNKRWKGVPFYLLAGKNMKEKFSCIYVEFKKAPCLLFSGVCNFMPNFLAIQIQPEEGFYIQLNAKVPEKIDITSVNMDFCHSCRFGNSPEAYENLLFDAIKGDQSAFIRSDEIEEAWKIIDNIKKPKVHIYKHKELPEAANKLIQKDGRNWHLTINYLTGAKNGV